jgi:CheY-like chemotaxis protein
MPELDGFAVCQLLKNDDTTKHIPVVAMSGNSAPENIVKITKAGADAFLKKPIDLAIFTQTVMQFIPTKNNRT